MYDDDVEEERYIGSGVILSRKWIMSSSKSVKHRNGYYRNKDEIFVRVGSNYWSKHGSIHGIKEIVYLGNNETAVLCLISLKRQLPLIDLVQPVKLSHRRLIHDGKPLGYYGWKSSDDFPLRMRKKFIPASRTDVVVLDHNQCNEFSKNTSVPDSTFCCSETLKSLSCTHGIGFPLLDQQYLVGIHTEELCDSKYNATIHMFENVTIYYNWLEDIIPEIKIEN